MATTAESTSPPANQERTLNATPEAPVAFRTHQPNPRSPRPQGSPQPPTLAWSSSLQNSHTLGDCAFDEKWPASPSVMRGAEMSSNMVSGRSADTGAYPPSANGVPEYPSGMFTQSCGSSSVQARSGSRSSRRRFHHRYAPREYIVEVLSEAEARAVATEVESPRVALLASACQREAPELNGCTALLLCPGPSQDPCSSLGDQSDVSDNKFGSDRGSSRSATISISSDECVIRDRLKQSLLLRGGNAVSAGFESAPSTAVPKILPPSARATSADRVIGRTPVISAGPANGRGRPNNPTGGPGAARETARTSKSLPKSTQNRPHTDRGLLPSAAGCGRQANRGASSASPTRRPVPALSTPVQPVPPASLPLHQGQRPAGGPARRQPLARASFSPVSRRSPVSQQKQFAPVLSHRPSTGFSQAAPRAIGGVAGNRR